jgi:hypothetical protein
VEKPRRPTDHLLKPRAAGRISCYRRPRPERRDPNRRSVPRRRIGSIEVRPMKELGCAE